MDYHFILQTITISCLLAICVLQSYQIYRLQEKQRNDSVRITGNYADIKNLRTAFLAVKDIVETNNRTLGKIQDEYADFVSEFVDLKDSVEKTDREERMLFQGMRNIMNYDMGQATRAVMHNGEDE